MVKNISLSAAPQVEGTSRVCHQVPRDMALISNSSDGHISSKERQLHETVIPFQQRAVRVEIRLVVM